MGPVAWAGLGWSVTIVPRDAERVVTGTEALNVNGGVLEERFASKAVRMMMVVVMMIRSGHPGRRMSERNMLARDGLCGRRGARTRACVPVIGECASNSGSVRKGTVRDTALVRKTSSVCTGRGASPAHSPAAKMAATAAAVPAAAAARSATGVSTTRTRCGSGC